MRIRYEKLDVPTFSCRPAFDTIERFLEGLGKRVEHRKSDWEEVSVYSVGACDITNSYACDVREQHDILMFQDGPLDAATFEAVNERLRTLGRYILSEYIAENEAQNLPQ